MVYKTTGFILKSTPLFEKDRRIVLFSKEHGKISALAKSANSTFKYGGTLECTNEAAFVIYKGKSMDYIQQCDIITHYAAIRTDYNRLRTALYFLEVILNTTSEHQENVPIYMLLKSALAAINDPASDILHITNTFHTYFLQCEGLIPKNNSHPNEHYPHQNHPIQNHPTQKHPTQNQQLISGAEFSKQLFQYCGKWIQQPSLITPSSV